MISFDEKRRINEVTKEVLSVLNVRKDINMAFILDKIIDTNEKVSKLKDLEYLITKLSKNQTILDEKLGLILRKIG